MSDEDRIDKMAEVVDRLAAAIEKRDGGLEKRLEALERVLDGQARIGNKLGALASVMERNIETVEWTRRAMLERANRVAEETKAIMEGRLTATARPAKPTEPPKTSAPPPPPTPRGREG